MSGAASKLRRAPSCSRLSFQQSVQCRSSLAELFVGDVGRGSQPQGVAPVVRPDILLAQRLLNRRGSRCRDRQEAANGVVPRFSRQNLELMLAELSQPLRGQFLLFKKLEYGCRPIMTGKVIGRAGKSRGARTVCNRAAPERATQIGELTKPSRYHRPEVAVLRESQKRIAWPQLA